MSQYTPPPYVIRRRATNKAASMLFIVLGLVGVVLFIGVGVAVFLCH